MASVNIDNPKIVAHVRKIARRGLKAIGLAYIGDVHVHHTGPRSGRMYYVPGTKTKYQASADGESPAKRTSRLDMSMGTRIDEDDVGLVLFAGSNVAASAGKNQYPKLLERGSPGGKIAPRPMWRVAWLRNIGRYEAIWLAATGVPLRLPQG